MSSNRQFSPLQFELDGSFPILNLGININVCKLHTKLCLF
jgi:hypothetical protein